MTVSPTLFRRSALTRRRMGAVLSAVALVALSAGWVGGGSANAAAANVVPTPGVVITSVDVCHGTGANGNPYTTNQPSTSSVITDPHGHGAHTGPVWTPGIVGAWGDIIPPFTYDLGAGVANYAGLNWDAWGEAIFRNGCNNPTRIAAVTPTVQPSTCVAGVLTSSFYIVPATPGVIYKVNGSTTAGGTKRTGVAPAFDTLTAVAASPAFFLTNAPFSQRIDFLPDAAGCTQVTAVKPDVQPSECVRGVVTPSYYDVPSVTGIVWKVGVTVVTGTRRSGSAPTTETLTAEAAPGFTLTAPFSETMTFLADAPGCTPATAANAGPVTASSCVANAAVESFYIVPTAANVQYQVTGVGNVASGSKRSGTAPASETLTAVAQNGFVLTAPFSQKIDFLPLATGCAPVIIIPVPPGVTDVCSNIDGVQTTVPPGYTVSGTTCTPPPVDVCTNLDGLQTSVPAGYTASGTTCTPVDEDLGISKTALEGSVVPGDVLSWSVNVTNVKGTPASAFTVTDVLADGLTFLTAGGVDWSCSNVGPTITCTYSGAPLLVGSSSAFQIDSLVGFDYAGSSVSNTAVVDPGGVDTTNDAATAVTPVVFTGGGGGTVVEPTPTPEPAPAEEPALPFTGSYTDKTLPVGVAMLVLGLFLALGGRRRRTN